MHTYRWLHASPSQVPSRLHTKLPVTHFEGHYYNVWFKPVIFQN